MRQTGGPKLRNKEDIAIKVKVKAEQRMEMTDYQKKIAEGNDKANESAKEGAEDDGAEMAEFVACEVKEGRKICAAVKYAAYFHVSVEDLNDVEKDNTKEHSKAGRLLLKAEKVKSTGWNTCRR